MRISIRDLDVTFYKASYRAWEREPAGPVMRELNRRGQLVQNRALILVGRKTGRLASSIRKNQGLDAKSAFVDVVAGRAGRGGTPYLGYHHYGAQPHVIRARRRKALRFTAGGQVVFRRQVMHPGTRGTYFLEFALPAASG